MDELDRLSPVLAVGVVVVHVRRHRAGPIEGDEGGDIVERVGGERADQGPHGRGLELEHPDGVASLEQFEGRAIVELDGVDVELDALRILDQLETVGDDVEVSQAQEVHLEQPEILDAVHLVLGDDRRLLDGLAGLGLALDREVLGERIVGDHHGGSVDAVLTAQTLEALGDIDDPGDIGVGVDHVAKLARGLVAVEILRVLFEAVLQRGVPAHDQRRHRLRDLVANGVGVAEHAGRVAHGSSGLDLAESHDLGDTVPAVHVSGVADHVVAIAGVEVHVDVGHR